MKKAKHIKYQYCFTQPTLLTEPDFLINDCVGQKLEKFLSKKAFEEGGLTLGSSRNDIKILIKVFSALFFNESLKNKDFFFQDDSFSLVFFTKTIMSNKESLLFIWFFDFEKMSLTRQQWEKMEGLDPVECCELNLGLAVSADIRNVLSDQNRQKALNKSCFFKAFTSFLNVRSTVSSYLVPTTSTKDEISYSVLYNIIVGRERSLRFVSENVKFCYEGFKTKNYEINCLPRFSFSKNSKNVDFFFECVFVTMWRYQKETKGVVMEAGEQKFIIPKSHHLLCFCVLS